MGKQVKDNPFKNFIPPSPEPKSGDFSSFIPQQPLSKEEARGRLERVAGFEGDSQYDNGLTYGMDQMKLRALNQPWYDQLGNNAAKLIPAIGLGILENAGYIGELFDKNQDYTNALTEWSQQQRGKLDENLTNYRENPNETFDIGDSGWWAQHGMGLTESIGEFLVTGAGVGATLGEAAKGLTSVLKANKLIGSGLQAAAQLGTASTLAYTEGAMSGAQVYKDVLSSGGTPEKAAQAAALTVRLNTLLNTGLNITSVSPLFKTFNNLHNLNKLGLARKGQEKLSDWALRLDQLEKAGVPQASLRKTLLLEAGQEALEEDVNLFAESEGRVKGGIEKQSSTDPIKRFFNKTFTQEGALNALLGALGGIGQTAGLSYIPYRKDENGNLVNNTELERLQNNNEQKALISDLKEDINYITTKQKELSNALENGNREGVDKARQELFNISTLRAIRNGTSQAFSEEIQKIGLTDNQQIGEDGKTEAMRQGLADSPEDNEFRTTAVKKAGDINRLNSEYETLQRQFKDKFTTDQVFRQRLNVYAQQENIDKLNELNTKLTSELSHLLTDPALTSIVSESADLSATNQLINNLEQEKDISPSDKTILENLKVNKMIMEKVLSDQISLDPSLEANLSANKGVVSSLMLNRIPLLYYNEQLKQEKRKYSKLLENINQTKEQFEPIKEAVINELKQKQQAKAEEQSKQQEEADLQEVKAKKEAQKSTYREIIGNFTVKSSPDGGFDLVDDEAGVVISNHPTVEEAKANAQVENKKAETQTLREQKPLPVIIEPASKKGDGPQIITKEIKDKEERIISEAIQENTITETRGKAKIAYRAKEGKDNNANLNEKYLLNHSLTFTKGSKITLKVDKQSPFYKEGQSIYEVPIGIYYNNHIVGYVPNYIQNKTDELIGEIREYIVRDPVVESEVIDKDLGVLNTTDRKNVTTLALPSVITFAVAKDDGKIYTGVGSSYSSENLVNKSFSSGLTYAIVNTPNGKEFAIPLDTQRITKPIADSIVYAFKVFLEPDSLTENETKLVNEIFDKYDIDIRTPIGFKKYFKSFLFNRDLSDSKEIEELNKSKEDKRWINFSGNSIRFLKSGGAVSINGKLQAKEISKNTPENIRESLLNELQSHIEKMFYNVDLEQLQDNSPVSLPIFSLDKNQNLIYVEYSKRSYEAHIADTTETNVVQFQVRENEYSSFIQPKIFFSTAFLGNKEKQNYGQAPKKSEETSNLANSEPLFESMTKRLPKTKVDTEQVTPEIVEERKKFCL